MVQYLFFSLVFYIFIWIIDFTEQTLDILVIFNVLNLIALIFYSYQKSKSIINAVIVFNITGFLYSNYGYFFGVNLSSYYYSKCLLLSSIAIQSYNIAYITWKIRKSTSKNTSYNFGKIWVISMLMMLLGVAIELYFFFFYIGFSNFISMTRSARSLMMIDAFYLANFYKPIITTIDVSDDYVSIPNRFGYVVDENNIYEKVKSLSEKKEKLKEKVDYDALNKKRIKLIEDIMEMK